MSVDKVLTGLAGFGGSSLLRYYYGEEYMHMPQAGANTSKDKQRKGRHIMLWVILCGSLVLLLDTYLPGNIRYYSKWVECGHMPYGTKREFRVGPVLGSYTQDKKFINSSSNLYCTARDAELHGLSGDSNSWQLNHVTVTESGCIIPLAGNASVSPDQIYHTCKGVKIRSSE